MATKKNVTEEVKETKEVVDTTAKIEDNGPVEEKVVEMPQAVVEPKKNVFQKIGGAVKTGVDKVVETAKKHPFITGAIVGGVAVAGGVATYNHLNKDDEPDDVEVETLPSFDPELEYLDELDADDEDLALDETEEITAE